MKTQLIETNQNITFEVKEEKNLLSNIVRSLEKLAHLKPTIKKIRKNEYDLDVFTNRKIVTLRIKINHDHSVPTLSVTIPLKKWIPDEIRAIQQCFYNQLGLETANNFIKFSQTKEISVKCRLSTHSYLNKIFAIFKGESRFKGPEDLAKLENYKFKTDLKFKNQLSPQDKDYRLWDIEILMTPKSNNIHAHQKVSKTAYRGMKLIFEVNALQNQQNREKLQDSTTLNLSLITPYSWMSFVTFMHLYTYKKAILLVPGVMKSA